MSTNGTIGKANLRVTTGFVMSRLQRSVSVGEIPVDELPVGEISMGNRPAMGRVTWELIATPGIEAFVEQAYRMVLGRPADDKGALDFCHHLSIGTWTRFEVISILRRSAEGRGCQTTIEGAGLRLRILTARWARWRPGRILDGLLRRLERARQRWSA